MRFLASLAVLLVAGSALPSLAQSDRNDPRATQRAQQYGQSQDNRPGQGYGRDRRRDRSIEIKSAFYGVENRSCEATRQVARLCDGKSSCTVPATNKLCGDPVHGVTKVLTVYYECKGRTRASTRWEGGYLGIRCE